MPRRKNGTLRWIPIGGLSVAALGLLWAVVSHFMPSANELPKTPQVEMKVQGDRSIAIGSIQNSKVELVDPKATKDPSETSSP